MHEKPPERSGGLFYSRNKELIALNIDTGQRISYTPLQVCEIAKQAAQYAVEQFLSTLNLDNDIPENASLPTGKLTVTVDEAAKMVGISKPKMYEIVRSRSVRSINVGKKILISRQSLVDWIERGGSYVKETC